MTAAQVFTRFLVTVQEDGDGFTIERRERCARHRTGRCKCPVAQYTTLVDGLTEADLLDIIKTTADLLHETSRSAQERRQGDSRAHGWSWFPSGDER